MRVRVKLFFHFANYLPGGSGELEVREGTTAGALLGQLGIPPNAPKVVVVNSAPQEDPWSCALREGDVVAVFPPLGGG